MKSIITILSVALTALSLSCTKQKAPVVEETYPETYEKKELFRLQWGSGPGQLGKLKSYGQYWLPCGIAVDKNMNIYLLDIVYKRLNVYDTLGTHLKTIKLSSIEGLYSGDHTYSVKNILYLLNNTIILESAFFSSDPKDTVNGRPRVHRDRYTYNNKTGKLINIKKYYDYGNPIDVKSKTKHGKELTNSIKQANRTDETDKVIYKIANVQNSDTMVFSLPYPEWYNRLEKKERGPETTEFGGNWYHNETDKAGNVYIFMATYQNRERFEKCIFKINIPGDKILAKIPLMANERDNSSRSYQDNGDIYELRFNIDKNTQPTINKWSIVK